MGNITGTLIENAFQPQTNNQSSLDIQEEIKKLARHSSNRELYRLLHAEMEHGTKERTSVAQGHQMTDTVDSDEVRRGAEKLESSKSSGDKFRAQSSFASSKYRNELPQTSEHSQFHNKDSSGKNGNSVAVLESSDKKPLDRVTKRVSDVEDSASAPQMSFKKKILNSYRTESEEVSTKVENTASQDPTIKIEEPVCTQYVGKSAADDDVKPLTRVLNFDNCIQVIVMNELQKLESLPDDLPGGKKLQLFRMLEGDAQKNKPGEVVDGEISKNRGSEELICPQRIEKTAVQSVNCDPKRDRWPPYGHMESASNQMPPEISSHRAMTRNEANQSAVSMRNQPSPYRLESSVTHEVPRMYASATGDGAARNSRQMANQPHAIASGELNASHGASHAKYPHPGMWNHRQEIPGQPAPHLLSTDPSYRTASSQMINQLGDLHRKVEKDIESSLKLQRSDYSSFSGTSQYSLTPSQPPQRSSYQSSPPVMSDKHHKRDVASYLYPTRVQSRERVQGPYETSYLNQSESLQPPVRNFMKHSPKNSPILAYEKEPLHPIEEPHYSRSELPKTSPGCPPAGSSRNYRTATDSSHNGYRGERPGRSDFSSDKRTFSMQNAAEGYEFEKHFRGTTAGGQDVPLGSEQSIQRSFSTSFPQRGQEVLDKVVPGPAKEAPLDLTTKKEIGGGHHASVFLLPKQHPPDWEMAKSVGYKPPYVRDDEQVPASAYRPASQKAVDFIVPEQVGRREVLHHRQAYEKTPPGLAMIQTDPDFLRLIPTPVQEKSMRTSVVASHPFDDTASNVRPPSHLTMQQVSEALIKNQLQSANNWKQSAYQEMLSQGHALLSDAESSHRGAPERRQRPNNTNTDLMHLSTTSPTIPHLSPIQPLAAPAGSQLPAGRRVAGPSLLGSHSPSDILHLQCKVCGSTYGSLRSFRMHFAKVHGLEPLPEHCNISTISGTKSAMSKFLPADDNEPPALQRETLPSDVGSTGKGLTVVFDQFSNVSRSVKPDIARAEVPTVGARTKQVAEVYPMPVRVTQGLSPQLKLEPMVRRSDVYDVHLEQTDGKMKSANDSSSGSHIVNCDLGIIRSRNCYSDLGCDVDCPECLDGFKDISDWKMHISTHMMRSCTCKACGVSFTHSGALRKHLQTVHTPTEKVDVEYRCLFCREVFSDEKILFQHTQEHEKKYSRVDNARRESGSSSQGYKHHGVSVDSDCIQMAVPDTTSSDDVRPTSGFGENSNNISPSADCKGSGFDRSIAELLTSSHSSVEPDISRKLSDVKTKNEKTSRVGVMDQGGKILMMLQRSEEYGLGCESTPSKSAASSNRSSVSASVARSESSDAEKEFKPAKAAEESVAFVSKKQALLKRFKSSEGRELVEGETTHLSSAHSNSNDTLSIGRPGSGVAPLDNSEVRQPMHLRDLFSIMGHQVEKSIRGIPDFPPVSSFAPSQRSRCVRDVCDEIIAQSFRKDRSPRESVSSVSTLESLELNSNNKIKEQFKNLLNAESDNRSLDASHSRSGAETSYHQNSGWMGSPCSSHDSYHSLEIDESQFDKERLAEDCGEIGRVESTDVEKHGLTCESLRRESDKKNASDLPENKKSESRSNNRLVVDQNLRSLENEMGSMQAAESYWQEGLDSARSEHPTSHSASVNLKESCSPTSTQKLESGGEFDGNSDASPKSKSSDQVPTPGPSLKRKHSSSDTSLSSKEANDDEREPIMKKPTS